MSRLTHRLKFNAQHADEIILFRSKQEQVSHAGVLSNRHPQ